MFKEYAKVETEKEEIVESIDESLIDAQPIIDDYLEESETNDLKIDVVKIGIVCDCFKLNVRKEPNLNAPVFGFLYKDAGVSIYTSFEDDNFYKIKTLDGKAIEGYCLKKYITTTY